ncbi:MAG: phosphoglucosamine mutase [Rickettsiales bacterium]|jgi:phosphoglucosamine mutase
MSKKYFGTDGIRGTANKFPITSEIALKVGQAVGAKFINGNHRHRVLIGKDTRLSGYMVESALTAGFLAVGMDVFLVGPVPTPAVSMLTKSLRADIGIMISASHNPFCDNGIKIFDKNGQKLSDEIEKEIESLIDGDITPYLAEPEMIGKAKRIEDAGGRYVEFVKNSFPKEKSLEGLKIVVDCANGAAYAMAPEILWELGAQVISIGSSPNGSNINEKCGSNHPDLLIKTVLENKADIGIALDGDADRLLVVDEKGKIVHGDKLIGLIAEKLHSTGNLKNDTVVATQMSNMALESYLRYFGVSLVRTNVGDRYVLEEMRKSGYNFGAEQSGHIVLGDYSTTGDGLIAALQILEILSEKKKTVSQIANIFELMPQILHNVKYQGDTNPLDIEEVKKAILDGEKVLDGSGRILVRKSGTEKLIRIMIEGKDQILINKIALQIGGVIIGAFKS